MKAGTPTPTTSSRLVARYLSEAFGMLIAHDFSTLPHGGFELGQPVPIEVLGEIYRCWVTRVRYYWRRVLRKRVA